MTIPAATLLPATAIASDLQCAVAIERIGWIRREKKKIESRLSEAAAKAKASAEAAANPLIAEETSLETKVRAYCDANRARLLTKGNKSASLGSGAVHWRDGLPSVEFPDGIEKKIVKPLAAIIVAALKELIGVFAPLVTVKITLSKTAIKAATKTDAELKTMLRRRGVVFIDDPPEMFSIIPAGDELAERPPAEAEAEAA